MICTTTDHNLKSFSNPGDPDYFTVILRFLRTRKLEVDGTGLILTSLYDEALFYSLDSIAGTIHIQ